MKTWQKSVLGYVAFNLVTGIAARYAVHKMVQRDIRNQIVTNLNRSPQSTAS